MNHYMVFLPNGETIHVWADNFHWKETGILTFVEGCQNVAVFSTDNICGMIRCEEGDAE